MCVYLLKVLKISVKETTYTVVSLSDRTQGSQVALNGKILHQKENLNFVGVIDHWLIWKMQVETNQIRARQRIADINKLASTR